VGKLVTSSLKTVRELADAGLIERGAAAALEPVAARYAVAITPEMAALIDPSDINDPIARQFVPQPIELDTRPEESADPIGDERHSPVRGVVHRHHDRVLLKVVNACPVYCRFCFRREMVGPGEGGLSPAEIDRALDYIAAHREIWEVILTGGDPFMLSSRRAADLSRRLSDIAHVKIVRWHTRVPVVDPARITPEFVAALKCEGKAVYVVLHANHPRELTPLARTAVARIVDSGIPMLSQSVLLKGVNDDVETLEALMRAFIEARIKPYYLHHPDPAPGTSHFRLPIEDGQALMRALRARASGLCLPTYVIDNADGSHKANLTPLG
jgi:lysine 2,3-aminomutase